MSVQKSPKSPFYQYDFKIERRRFVGSTKSKLKKEAEVIERQLKAQARKDIELEKLTGNAPPTLQKIVLEYYEDVGQFHVCKNDTYRDLDRAVKFFGPDKRIDMLTHADAASLIASRRKDTRWGKKKLKEGVARTVSNATVNRSVIALLKKLMGYAKEKNIPLPLEPKWKKLWLPEAEERKRELNDTEADAIEDAVRPDYADWLDFTHMTGLRLKETLLTWKQVNFSTAQIIRPGKQGKWVTTPITPSILAILERQKGKHPVFVFTYIPNRTRKPLGIVRGRPHPITYAGAKSEWQRIKKATLIEDFRLHDLRHDRATKLLRETGNLKLVQQALNHSDIKVTTRYAHVLDSEVAQALEASAQSRKRSRKALTVAA